MDDGWANECRCHVCGTTYGVDSSLLVCDAHGGRGSTFVERDEHGVPLDRVALRAKAKAHFAECLRRTRERSAFILGRMK